MNEYLVGRLSDYFSAQSELSLSEQEFVHLLSYNSRENQVEFYRNISSVEVTPDFISDNSGIGLYTTNGLGVKVSADTFNALTETVQSVCECINYCFDTVEYTIYRTGAKTSVVQISSSGEFMYETLKTQLAGSTNLDVIQSGNTWGAKETQNNLLEFYTELLEQPTEHLEKEFSSGKDLFENGLDGVGPKRSERLANALEDELPEFEYLFSNNKAPYQYLTEAYITQIHSLFGDASISLQEDLIVPIRSIITPYGGFYPLYESDTDEVATISLESYPNYFTKNDIRVNVTRETDWPFVSEIERGEQLLIEAKGLFLLSIGAAEKLPEM